MNVYFDDGADTTSTSLGISEERSASIIGTMQVFLNDYLEEFRKTPLEERKNKAFNGMYVLEANLKLAENWQEVVFISWCTGMKFQELDDRNKQAARRSGGLDQILRKLIDDE